MALIALLLVCLFLSIKAFGYYKMGQWPSYTLRHYIAVAFWLLGLAFSTKTSLLVALFCGTFFIYIERKNLKSPFEWVALIGSCALNLVAYILENGRFLLIWGMVVFASLSAFSQAPPEKEIKGDKTQDSLAFSKKYPLLYDTVRVSYRYKGDLATTGIDTSISLFHRYAPYENSHPNAQSLVMVGGALQSSTWRPVIRKGAFDGIESYSPYRLLKGQIPYYDCKFPFTELSYNQASQANSMVGAKFGWNLGPRINYTIDYNLINQSGFLNEEKARHENFGAGFRFVGKKNRYRAYLTYVTNKIRQQQNGGLKKPSEFDALPSFVGTLKTNISGAEWEERHMDISLSQEFFLGRDSATRIANGAKFSLETTYYRSLYRFFDKDTTGAAPYYDTLFASPLGLRFFQQRRAYTLKGGYEQPLGKADLKGLGRMFNVGVFFEYTLNDVYREPEQANIHNIFLSGKLGSNPDIPSLLYFQLYGHLGLGQGAGDFALKADAKLNLKKFGQLTGHFLTQAYEPSLQVGLFNVTGERMWTNAFLKKVFETTIHAAYALPKYQFSAGVNIHTIGNHVYFDTLALPQQLATPIGIFEVYGKYHLKVWRFHLDNQVTYQKTTSDFMRLPDWVLRHSFYFETRMFKKKMLFQIGADLRYTSPWKANEYMPLTGQFHLQNQKMVTNDPLLDAFINFKVRSFRFFIMGENLGQNIWKKAILNAPSYPLAFNVIRFGVVWQLRD